MHFIYSELSESIIYCPSCSWIGFGRQSVLDKTSFSSSARIICPSCGIALGMCFFKSENLVNASQLKDIEDENIYLIWSFSDYQTVRILYHTEIIWEEPITFECYNRFIQIAKILKTKYGTRLKDLIPSENSYPFLYGDNFSADEIINRTRSQIRNNTLI